CPVLREGLRRCRSCRHHRPANRWADRAVPDWRGLFLFLALTGVVLFIATLSIFRETLPVDRRTGGGLRQVGQGYRRLLADRLFVGATILIGFVYAAVFAYLSGATYVLQGSYGLSPQEYSLVFGLTA